MSLLLSTLALLASLHRSVTIPDGDPVPPRSDTITLVRSMELDIIHVADEGESVAHTTDDGLVRFVVVMAEDSKTSWKALTRERKSMRLSSTPDTLRPSTRQAFALPLGTGRWMMHTIRRFAMSPDSMAEIYLGDAVGSRTGDAYRIVPPHRLLPRDVASLQPGGVWTDTTTAGVRMLYVDEGYADTLGAHLRRIRWSVPLLRTTDTIGAESSAPMLSHGQATSAGVLYYDERGMLFALRGAGTLSYTIVGTEGSGDRMATMNVAMTTWYARRADGEQER